MINPKVRYLTQRDNINPYTGKPEGHNQCMVASFTMLMNWLGDRFNRPELAVQYNEHLHLLLVGGSLAELEKKRYQSANHAKVCNDYLSNLKPLLPAQGGSKKVFFKTAMLNYDDVRVVSDTKQSPLVVGSMITHVGHIIVYNGQGWNDPYGTANEQGRYVNFTGDNVQYSENFCRNMIFREVDPSTKQTTRTNAKRTCWYIEGLL